MFFVLKPVLKSKFVQLKTKHILCKVTVRAITLYASETWTTTKTNEQKIAEFERKLSLNIFGPKKMQFNWSMGKTDLQFE